MDVKHPVAYAALTEFFEPEAAKTVLEVLDNIGQLNNNRKKLTPTQVREIRLGYKQGLSQAELAHHYDLNPATVSRIVSGEYH